MQRKILLEKCTQNGTFTGFVTVFTDSIESYSQEENGSLIVTKTGREFYVKEKMHIITKEIDKL